MNFSSSAIVTHHLAKTYRSLFRRRGLRALDGVSLDVPRGSIFGFLGPNGAGKTTTINILLGIVYPTEGSGEVLGLPLGHCEGKRRIGFLPEKFQFHDFLTATEFLDLHARFHGLDKRTRKERIERELVRVGLIERRHSKLREFSKGMQQRIGLAQALINDPDLVILDEPTSALDPLGRRDVRRIIGELKAEGKTVFLNSHLLSEVELTCDAVAIVNKGRIVRQGTLSELLQTQARVELHLQQTPPAVLPALRRLALNVNANADRLTVDLASEDDIPRLVEETVKAGGKILAVIPYRMTLEELFVRTVEEGRDNDP
ncbi:MAG: ABC transporter ATP-binding protein [Abditibacteriales bacterium]|nr:ABC transporter ATP-binding protein [Abditibacteriales bacterium]